VSPDPQSGAEGGLPLAMAAMDVAGQIRERSPTDLAIFGEAAGRLVERFTRAGAGQALLARAVAEGAAETVAWLTTAAGPRRFRVSLWRQRGGERIRILAAFATFAAAADASDAALSSPLRDAVLRLGRDMAPPLEAVIGLAGLLRGEGAAQGVVAEHASDIVAAAWRLKRIAEDLLAAEAGGGALPPLRAAEVDIGRVVRRIARLAAPAARAAGIAIEQGRLPAPGQGPLVLGDESTLWSAIDTLLRNALHHGGRGATVAMTLETEARGLVLSVADDGPGIESDRLAGLLGPATGGGLAVCRTLVAANGAALEIDSAPPGGLTARIVFPAARCLNPV